MSRRLVFHPCPRGCGADVLITVGVAGRYEPAHWPEPPQCPEIVVGCAPQCLGEPPCRLTLAEQWGVEREAYEAEDERLYKRYEEEECRRFAAIRRMGRGPV